MPDPGFLWHTFLRTMITVLGCTQLKRLQLKRLHQQLRWPCHIFPSFEATALPIWAMCCLQAGTSHDLGDNFAKAFGTQFLNEAGDLVHPQQSSWGASTRLIGGIIMTHGAPPCLAAFSCHGT